MADLGIRTATGEIPSVLQPVTDSSPPPTEDQSVVSDSVRRSATPSDVIPISRNSATPRATPPKPRPAGAVKKRKLANGAGKDFVPIQPLPAGDSPNLLTSAAKAKAALEGLEQGEAGPSSVPARKPVIRKPKKKLEKLFQYTNAFAPGLYNVKNPAGDFLQRESNVDVIRQVSQARAKKEKEDEDTERARRAEAGEEAIQVQSLYHTLIIHPGSRNLRIGRASDFYPKEIPFCIARPRSAASRVRDAPLPGSRVKRLAEEAKETKDRKKEKSNGNGNGHSPDGEDVDMVEGDEDEAWSDPVEKHIDDLRDYLRTRLRQNRLSTDYRDGIRVKQFNAKVRPEPIPEHNDPYRIDWTEETGKKFFVGTEALRLPAKSGFQVRYPLLERRLNTRDWGSSQLLLDDIATILHEALRTGLDIHPLDYHKYSVVLLVPDHSDRLHLQAFASLLLGEFAFKEMAVHQEGYAAIFSAGMSTACVVDIGATTTSVTCVDEGQLVPETRIKLDYGGDDITAALVALLTRSNFPYKELDLARPVDWTMMEKLKERISTLEEHMVANISWDIYVLKEQGLTQKYQLRTYDENILAPLCFFDTRMIDFVEKEGAGRTPFWEESESIDDQVTSSYGEATAAMRSCTTHLLPAIEPAAAIPVDEEMADPDGDPKPVDETVSANGDGVPAPVADTPVPPKIEVTGSLASSSSDKGPAETPAGSANGTPAPPDSINGAAEGASPNLAATAVVTGPVQADIPASAWDGIDIIGEAAKSPLDAAIAASISMAGTENKIKAAAGSILLIGGGSALKGLYPFVAERLPPLLRAKGLPIAEVSIVPPPRGLNPRFVSWKGASVMCNLESLNDMWIRRDEWEALGARTLKDRLPFL